MVETNFTPRTGIAFISDKSIEAFIKNIEKRGERILTLVDDAKNRKGLVAATCLVPSQFNCSRCIYRAECENPIKS